MRIRAGLASLVMVGGLVAGCGGEAADDPTTTTTTKDSESTTTTEDPALRPWRSVPIPQITAELAPAYGGRVIETIGLVYNLNGPVDVGALYSDIAGDLKRLGLEIETDDPVAVSPTSTTFPWTSSTEEAEIEGPVVVLEITLDVERSSAEYQASGTCWSGLSIEGSVSVLFDGVEQGSYLIDAGREPPNVIHACPERTTPVNVSGHVAGALEEIFGPPMILVREYASEDHPIGSDHPLMTDEALPTVLAGLFDYFDRVREVSQWVIQSRFSETTSLTVAEEAAIPVLIAAFDYYREQGWTSTPLVSGTGDLLRAYTGRELPEGFKGNCPAHWWLLWQGDEAPDAPCYDLSAG